MGVLSWLNRQFARPESELDKAKARSLDAHSKFVESHTRSIQARYDNAMYDHENRRQWWMADYMSAKSANNFAVRRTLRMRSRYEVSNNPYLFGVCNSNADDLIGTGPTLQVTTSDEGYNRKVEAAWREWCQEVSFVEKLRTLKLARTVDGEGFLVLKTAESLENPVKLYPVDVEADQVTCPAPKNLGELWVDGLDLDPVTERPTAYHVLNHHPGDYYFPDFNPMSVVKVSKQFVIHWFVKFRPGQVRGVPLFTPSLDLFTELRSFRKASLGAAEIAADFAAIIKTNVPGDTNPNVVPFSHAPIDRKVMTALPAGYEMTQFRAEHPATSYEMFQEKCLGEALRPLNYPLNLALGTSQKFNFSSSKLDHINYRNSLDVERADCEVNAVNRLFAAWHYEALLAGVIPPAPGGNATAVPSHEWHWPGYAMLDPAVDSAADAAMIAAGLVTLQQYWAKRGYDWETIGRQLVREKKFLDDNNLSYGEVVKRSVTQATDPDSPDAVTKGEPANAA